MYNDSLVQITDDSLIIKDYYFPGISKQIPLDEIDSIKLFEPSLFTGQLRIWGMGLWPVWFAMDWKRPWRDTIFIVNIKDSWLRVGFTADNSKDLISEISERGIPIGYD